MGQDEPITTDEEGPDSGRGAKDAERERDARWVAAAVAGDREAFGHLYDAWFDRVFNLVDRVVRDQEVAAEVTQDAFLSAWRNLAGLEDRKAFGGWLLRIARNAAYNRSKREARSRPVDDDGMAMIEGTGASPVSAPSGFGVESKLARYEDPETAAADDEVATLVRETVAALGERDAEVLDLQLRYNLTPAEIGEVIGINRNAANQLCHRVRAKFATAFGVRMLWSGSRPACDQLDALLVSAGVESFGPDAIKLADKHAKTCDVCDERRELRLQPAALFAAVPFLAAPMLLKAKVAGALEVAGVPMSGSSAVTGAGPGAGSTAGSGSPAGSVGATGSGSSAVGLADGDVPLPGTAAPTGRGRTLAMVAAAVVVLVIALVAVIALSSDDGPADDEVLVAEGAPTSTTSVASSATTGAAPDDTLADETLPVDESLPLDLDDGVDPADGQHQEQPPAVVDPGQPDQQAAPLPVVNRFSLLPTGAEDRTFTIGSTSPTLRWDVSNGSTIRVWEWINGVRSRVVATTAVGSLKVCPGVVSGATCNNQGVNGGDNASFIASYTVEVTNVDGVTVTSDEVNRPGFEVSPEPG